MRPFDIRDIMPEQVYELFSEGKLIDRFSSYQEAQIYAFKNSLVGPVIKLAERRSKMSKEAIQAAEYLLNLWGNTTPY